MGKTLSLGLLGAFLASFLPLASLAAVRRTEVFAQDFEAALCGTVPKGMGDAFAANKTNELCRYVTNIDAATGGQSLMYDFSQLAASSRTQNGRSHGWLSWWGNENLTNGWLRWSMSVKRLSGSMTGEIRSTIGWRSRPSVKSPMWIAYWLALDESFRVRCEGRNTRNVEIGKLPQGRWCRLDLVLPLPSNPSTNAYGRVSVKGADGRFAPGPRVAIPLGDLRVLSGYHLMQLGGSGHAKWLLDDISLMAISEM